MLKMTLQEALEIKKAITEKRDISKVMKGNFIRLNPSFVNVLAGLTESFCKNMKVGQMTRRDLEKMHASFKADWILRGRKKDEFWGKKTAIEKILENWKETEDGTVDSK